MKNRQWSLVVSPRTILLIAAIIAACLGALHTVEQHRLQHLLTEELNARVQSVLDIIIPEIRLHETRNEQDALDRLMGFTLRVKDVEGIEIYNNEGRLIKSYIRNPTTFPDLKKKQTITTSVIGPENLTILVHINTLPVEQSLKKQSASALIEGGVALLLTSLLMVLLLNHLMSQSLTTLSREANERGKEILNAAGDGILGFSIDDTVVFANPMVKHLLGWSEEDLLGKPAHLVFHQEADTFDAPFPDGFLLTQAIESSKQNTPIIAESCFRCRDGRILDVAYTSTPISEDGEHTGTILIFRDISTRIQLESSLELANKAFEYSSEAILITDESGNVIQANQAFDEIHGFNMKSVLRGGGDSEYGEVSVKICKGLHHEGRWSGELWNRSPDGEIHPLWLTLNAVRDTKGTIVNLVGIFSDI
ncbi:MAG: PAS domain S-box protein, partial [Magnetococcales bacterium]|nr:PAS domain S-box protein [Magnetococcales bacterium]